MNEQLNTFLTSIGALCETWTVVYQSFLNQGLSHSDAMAHTQGFMTAFISSGSQNNKD
jgi:hypothetical protein